MKEWYSLVELAGLPGMPKTRAGVRRKAARLNWQGRMISGFGGFRQEICFEALPSETKNFLLKNEGDAPAKSQRSMPGSKHPGLYVVAGQARIECTGLRLDVFVKLGATVALDLPSGINIRIEGIER